MPRPRNRAQTEERILDAARTLLSEFGFSNFGINAIAREAKTDKVLIYRYFESVDGILHRIIASLVFWPDGLQLNASTLERFLSQTFEHLRKSPLPALFLIHQLSPDLKQSANERHHEQLREWKAHFQSQFEQPPADSLVDLAAHCLFTSAALDLPFPSQIQTVISGTWASKASTSVSFGGSFSAEDELPTELL